MNSGFLSFEPVISMALWWALVIGGIALLIWYLRKRPSAVSPLRWACIGFLMGAGMLLVWGLLLNPTWVEPVKPPGGKPQLTILVDGTGSMASADGESGNAGKTRFAAAAELAKQIDASMSGQFDVRVRSFIDTGGQIATDTTALEKLDPASIGGQTTDLSTALQESLDADREQGQAVVLLSDGIHNASGGVARIFDVLRLARSLDTPVYTRTFGGTVQGIDLAIDLRTPQELAFVGQNVPVTAMVHHVGMDRGAVDVMLLEGGKEVARQRVTMVPGGAAQARFWVKREAVGVYPYEVRVAALPGENSQTNNVATYMLRVIDHPIRVLLLEGKPYWDSKFLVRTLSGVPAVELDSVVKLAESRLVRRTWNRQAEADPAGARGAAPPAPPAARRGASRGAAPAAGADPTIRREQEWQLATTATQFLSDPASLKNYQIIVLGRDAGTFLDGAAVANLQRWIAQDGGSLVCYRGEPAAQMSSELVRLLPVHWERSTASQFRMQLTDQGREMNWLPSGADEASLGQLPALAANTRIDRTGPLAVVLAQGVGQSGAGGEMRPAVVYQPYGTGRVVVIEGSGMWRWAFLPPQLQDKDETYDALWHSVLRWVASGVPLMPGQKMSLRMDKIAFGSAEVATATVLMRDGGKPPDVELVNVDKGEKATFTPAALGAQAGTYRVAFGKLPEGVYQVKLVGADPADAATRSIFDVRNVSAEQLDLKARPDLMARIAADTGGSPLGADVVGQLPREFQRYHTIDRPPQTIKTTAWDRWWVFVGLMLTWGLAWALRRSGGLV